MTDEIVLLFAFIVLRFYRSDGAINWNLTDKKQIHPRMDLFFI